MDMEREMAGHEEEGERMRSEISAKHEAYEELGSRYGESEQRVTDLQREVAGHEEEAERMTPAYYTLQPAHDNLTKHVFGHQLAI